MTNSVFYSLSEKECEAVATTEGAVIVCALKSSVPEIVEGHKRFLSEILGVPNDSISEDVSSENSLYIVTDTSCFDNYVDFVTTIHRIQQSHKNIYCVDCPSAWKKLCKTLPISSNAGEPRFNVTIDCTEHKTDFFIPRPGRDILEARWMLSDILAALASYKPPVIVYGETDQDWRYIDNYKNTHKTTGCLFIPRFPSLVSIGKAEKIVTLVNSWNDASYYRLKQIIETIGEIEKFRVILYTTRQYNNPATETLLQWNGVTFYPVTPNYGKIGVASISNLTSDLKKQLSYAIDSSIAE
ncbi:MAG: hypothetical protein K5867_04580 [Bacteroidales bacterium]|nr:hypothetical protein [Bacteroidales bacterium]